MKDRTAIRILVLDDEPFMLKLLGRMLDTLGHGAVRLHQEGAAALAACEAADGMPDVVLLDINMPGMDGVQFVRHLAERRYRCSLILVSGEDDRMLQSAERLARAHRLSVLGVLQKPPAPARLAALLAQWQPAPAGEPRQAATRYGAGEVAGAIRRGELVNHYQPKVIVATGEVAGVEALVRWQHPDHGLVFPDRFVPVAEEHGLVGELTRAVLRGALAQARAWQDAGLGLRVAVNVSMDDLARVEFADFVVAETAASGVPPQAVTLEVTESRLMQSLTTALDVLTRLRLKRFRLAIDDFGTGHSSLVQLRDLPFDELKIDRSFTHCAGQDPRLSAIFAASVNLARQLGIEVVAEGVEDARDWAFLRASGCQFAQGYHIARPMAAEAVWGWLRDWRLRAGKESDE